MSVQRKLKRIGKLKNKLKNKNGFVQSTDFVIIFATTIILVLILIELTFAIFSIYTINVTTNNVARLVAVNGYIDNEKGQKIYDVACKQLGNKIVDGSLEIELETTMTNTDYIPEMTTTLRSGLYPKYAINLGDEFKVHMKGDIVLFHIAGHPVTTKLSSTASGVGEVYFKYNPTK